MKNKKPVPYTYYNEMCNELARAFMDAKSMPARQQKRIDDVIASGKDHEVMQGGNGTTWQIPLTKLYEYLEQAKAVDVDAKYKEWQDYKATHEGIKGLKGYLSAAKTEAALKKMKYPDFFDSKYDFYHRLINKHYLSNNESEKLMSYLISINIL